MMLKDVFALGAGGEIPKGERIELTVMEVVGGVANAKGPGLDLEVRDDEGSLAMLRWHRWQYRSPRKGGKIIWGEEHLYLDQTAPTPEMGDRLILRAAAVQDKRGPYLIADTAESCSIVGTDEPPGPPPGPPPPVVKTDMERALGLLERMTEALERLAKNSEAGS